MRSSPERRRLRFSFHINNVKDPEPKLPDPPESRTNRLTPRRRRRRLSIRPQIPRQTVFYKTAQTQPPETPKGKTSKPWPPSRESNPTSQERISRETQLDFRRNPQSPNEPFQLLPGSAPSIESKTTCQSNPHPQTQTSKKPIRIGKKKSMGCRGGPPGSLPSRLKRG